VSTRKILFIFGTRPEAIKLSPVVQHLRAQPRYFDVRVCVTAQHRDMLDQVLPVFRITPDYDLGVMQPGQTLFQSTARILTALEPVMAAEKPDMVLVQGDTTTTFCGGLAAFYANVPVGHVEAGLRTDDMRQPFPEEMNRVLVSRVTDLHFAATQWAAGNLRSEGVPDSRIHVTGNSGIDAMLRIRDLLQAGGIAGPEWPGLDPAKRLIVVTAHRRESFGEGFERICAALSELAAKRSDVQIVYPVHPNPNVTGHVHRYLQGRPNILLINPLEYVAFVDLMRRSYLLITDSGGVQEEGPSLGKPVLVLREKTERPEAVKAGTVTLVGSDIRSIVDNASWLLDDAAEYNRRSHIHNPYGDGHACQRIAGAIRVWFGDAAAPEPEFDATSAVG
jgi:UDP-N-acetylglucosamine 2-epimerase (non-hydrolysing)